MYVERSFFSVFAKILKSMRNIDLHVIYYIVLQITCTQLKEFITKLNNYNMNNVLPFINPCIINYLDVTVTQSYLLTRKKHCIKVS